ncbi:MAG: hypothetical protein ACI8RZ_004953 [Myxococcota bacterium]
MKFFYCKDASGGDPVLMIGEDLDSKQIEELESRSERCARGELISGSKGLIFQIEQDDLSELSVDELEYDIHHYFSRKVSALKSARVVSRSSTPSGRWDESLSL